MAEYYRTVFSITKQGLHGLDLIESASTVVFDWAKESMGPCEPVTDSPDEWDGVKGRLRVRRHVDHSFGTYRLVWERPAPCGDTGRWRLSVRLATVGEDVEADIEVLGLEGQHEGGCDEYLARLPTVPTKLLTAFDCRLDGRRLTTTARRIIDHDDATSFAPDDLFNPDRQIPLVVVSRDSHRAGVDEDRLQEMLLGLAFVVSYDHDMAWFVSKDLPQALRCYDGAVRLYSPGCSPTDISQQNPYWLLTDAQQLQQSTDRFWLMLRDECVNRVSRHTRRRLFSSVRQRIQNTETERLESRLSGLEEQQSELETELKRRRDELESEIESRRSYLGDDLSAIQALEAELDLRRQELEAEMENRRAELETDLFDIIEGDADRRTAAAIRIARAYFNRSERLADELKQLTARVKQIEPRNGHPDSSNEAIATADPGKNRAVDNLRASPQPRFTTLLECVEHAHRVLGGLRFLPTAFEAAGSSQFHRADEVYRKLVYLDDCARARRNGPLGIDVTAWLEQRGVDFAAHEGERVDAQFKLERTFYDREQDDYVYMPAHIRMGRGELRIHVSWVENEGRWLIGHVGPHLRVAKYM